MALFAGLGATLGTAVRAARDGEACTRNVATQWSTSGRSETLWHTSLSVGYAFDTKFKTYVDSHKHVYRLPYILLPQT